MRLGWYDIIMNTLVSNNHSKSVSFSCSIIPSSLWPHGLQPTRLLCPWDFPGKDAGVGCHFLLQRIFPTQGSNPGLLHCRQILYWMSYKGSPIIMVFYSKPSQSISVWSRNKYSPSDYTISSELNDIRKQAFSVLDLLLIIDVQWRDS